VEEEATHHVRETLAQQHGEEHELVVQDEDEVTGLVGVGYHLGEGGREGGRGQ